MIAICEVGEEGIMAEPKKDEKKDKTRRWPPKETRQHIKTARSEIRESFKSLFPPEFVEHRRAARREMLLAVRSLIDRAIERVDAKEGA
jgi:hypothetical protein